MSTRDPEGLKSNPRLELPPRESWGLKPRTRSGGAGTWLLAALVLAAVSLQVFSLLRGPSIQGTAAAPAPAAPASRESSAGIPAKDLSARLQRINLPLAAAKVQEEHLQTLGPDKLDERRKALVTLGNLLVKAGRYEEAIVRFYQAEFLQVDAQTQALIDQQVKECLEKLGKHNELAYELADRTQPGRKPGASASAGDEAAGKVVAQIGIEMITSSDLDDLIAKEVDRQLGGLQGLEPKDREQYRAGILKELQEPQRRLQKLQEMVARKVLYREGMERDLDKDPALQRELETVRENLIARQVVLEAMQKQIKISEGDLKLFFQAAGDRYLKKASARARIAVFADEAQAQAAIASIHSEEDFTRIAREKSLEESTRAGGGLLEAPVVEGEPVPVLGDEPALAKAILGTAAGSVTAKPAALKKGAAIAWVIEAAPPRRPNFQEVREEVARDYTQRKEMEVQQALLAELFKKHAASVHTEAFLKLGDKKTDGKPDAGKGAPASGAPAGGAAPAKPDAAPVPGGKVQDPDPGKDPAGSSGGPPPGEKPKER